MKNKLILAILCASAHSIDAMMQERQLPVDLRRLHVYAIPGQNGSGSEARYVKKLLGKKSVEVTQVQTPTALPDLGQNRCIKYLREAVKSRGNSPEGIIHATSQGTATALNYVAYEDKGKQIKALILESTLGSGNSGIHHTASGPLMEMTFPALSKITNLPLSYYWAPYVAKAMFPAYSPSGKQAIRSIKDVPTNMLVVIAHSKEDMQLSYDDACALYYGLREQGNNNAYLITKDGDKHLWILKDDKQVVRAILHKHTLLASPDEEQGKMLGNIDLSAYQPPHQQFKKQHDALVNKEKNHLRLGYLLTAGICVAACYFIKKIYDKRMRSVATA